MWMGVRGVAGRGFNSGEARADLPSRSATRASSPLNACSNGAMTVSTMKASLTLASRPTSSRTSFMDFCRWAMFRRPSSEAMEALTLAQAAEVSSAETALSAIARTETDWYTGARACGAIGT